MQIERASSIAYEKQEAHERKLDLSVHGLACVERLVAYMYALDYEGGVVDEIQIDVRIYGLADMFDIAALKETALAKFKQDISAWDVKFVKAHQALIVDTIRAAYDGPYPSICEPLVHKLVGLCGRSEDVTAPLLDLIEEIPTFGKDLAKQMTKALAKNKRIKRPDERRYVCPSMGEWCKATFRARIGESMETVTCYACQASFPASKWEALATDE